MKSSGLLLLFIFQCIQLFSQDFTINGYVEDAKTGERLIGAVVYDSISQNGFNCNAYGYFALKLHHGPINLKCSYLGYDTRKVSFSLEKDTSLNIFLQPKAFALNEVIVYDRIHTLKRSQISTVELPIITIKNIPSLMGETDLLKALQLLPGVQSGTEGTGGLYVRGGGPDQNLILLDGVSVYNPDHLFGFVSVFNSDAIKNVTLIKGGFPAQYGGRLSSIVDIRMKEGNNKETHGEAAIGLISSKLMVEGPLVKDRSSYLISARRSWIDIFTRSLLKKKELPYGYFYDLTAKINHIFSNQSRLYFSIYIGRDKITSINTSSETVMGDYKYNNRENQYFGWGNITSSLRWNYSFSNKLFSNTSINYSDYKYFDNKLFYNSETNVKTGLVTNEDYESEFHSGIKDIAIKSDFDFQPFTGHKIKFGAGSIYHLFTPNAQISMINTGMDSSLTGKSNYRLEALEPSIYIEDDIEFNSRLKVNAGLRISGFLVKSRFYGSIEPRVSGRYLLTDRWAAKLAYSRMKQYVHLLTSSRVTFPTDLWVPSTDKVKPQMSDQVAVGSVYNFNKNFELSIEAYYKTMNDLIEYSEGSSFLDNNNWESKVEKGGRGRAYGLEIMLQKNAGRTTGWIAYTLSKTERQFDNISFGKWFP